MPRWALASVSSFLIFPLPWSYGQYESVLKENPKFFFHFKHSVTDHSSSPSSLQPSMPRDPSVPYNDNLWLRDRGGHLTQGQRPSIDVLGQPASLLQEFDLRDTESVVGLMESPGAESPGWLGGWGGYFGVIWKMTKQRKLKMCGKREREPTKRSGHWEAEKRALGPDPAIPMISDCFLSVFRQPWDSPRHAHSHPWHPTYSTFQCGHLSALCNSKGLGITPRLMLSPSPSCNPRGTCVSSLACSPSRELQQWQGATRWHFTDTQSVLFGGRHLKPHPQCGSEGLGRSSPHLSTSLLSFPLVNTLFTSLKVRCSGQIYPQVY